MTVRDPAALFSCGLPPQPRGSAPPAVRGLGSLHGRQPSAGSSAGVAWLEAEPGGAARPLSPALQKAPPARAVRKTEGPMDGQGRERMWVRQCARRRGREARWGCAAPEVPWSGRPEACVTSIPGRQAGPRALGPRATKPAKRSQLVRARALLTTLTLVPGGLCSW